MIERVDNTKAMATWGRGILTLIIVMVWASIQFLLSLMLVDGLGLGSVATYKNYFLAVCALAFSGVLPISAWRITIDIWRGPEKAEESR